MPEWDVFLSEKQSQWKQMKARPGPAVRQCADGTYTSQCAALFVFGKFMKQVFSRVPSALLNLSLCKKTGGEEKKCR